MQQYLTRYDMPETQNINFLTLWKLLSFAAVCLKNAVIALTYVTVTARGGRGVTGGTLRVLCVCGRGLWDTQGWGSPQTGHFGRDWMCRVSDRLECGSQSSGCATGTRSNIYIQAELIPQICLEAYINTCDSAVSHKKWKQRFFIYKELALSRKRNLPHFSLYYTIMSSTSFVSLEKKL